VTGCDFPPSRRLRFTRDFDRVYSHKQRAGDRHLLVFAAPSPSGTTRIGLSVSRKHGNSVVRHRLKRILREAYRLSQTEIPEGLDLVLIPRQEAHSTLDDYRASLVALTRQLGRRILRPSSLDPASQPGSEA
jgi:ribonuclease P protein component